MILCFCYSVFCFLSLSVCCLFKNIFFLQFKIISSSFLFQSASQVSSSDLNAVSWSQWYLISLFDFVIHVFVNFVISLNYIYNLLEMMSYSWFCFLCCCTQTVLLTTVVLSCSDFYWYSVSNIFLLFNLFIHSVHSSINNTLSTFFFLSWVLL